MRLLGNGKPLNISVKSEKPTHVEPDYMNVSQKRISSEQFNCVQNIIHLRFWQRTPI